MHTDWRSFAASLITVWMQHVEWPRRGKRSIISFIKCISRPAICYVIISISMIVYEVFRKSMHIARRGNDWTKWAEIHFFTSNVRRVFLEGGGAVVEVNWLLDFIFLVLFLYQWTSKFGKSEKFERKWQSEMCSTQWWRRNGKVFVYIEKKSTFSWFSRGNSRFSGNFSTLRLSNSWCILIPFAFYLPPPCLLFLILKTFSL